MPSRQSTTTQRLSPSRIKDFEQCPKLFHFKSLGLSTPPTAATAKGTLVHYAFERVFDHPRSERDVETALRYVKPAWRLMLEPFATREAVDDPFEIRLRDAEKGWLDPDTQVTGQTERKNREAAEYRHVVPLAEEAEFLAGCEDAVRGWFRMETPSKFDPAEREFYVAAKVAGVDIHGYIDRLDRVVGADGSVRFYVTDYKTGKPPSPRFADDAFFQLEVYALLVDRVLGTRPYEIRLVYVREGRPDAVLTRKVTTATLKDATQRINRVAKEIQEAQGSGNWTARRQTLCGWCQFQNACPAYVDGADQLTLEEIAMRTGTTLSPR